MTSPAVTLTSSSACPVTSAAAVVSSASSSSSSQYLLPDYMQMMPSSFDAKNSPLALLAQTCNSIGKDPTPPPQSSTSGSGHKSSTSSLIQSAAGITSVSGSSSATSTDRKDYLGVNGREGLTSSSRAKSESPTTSGGGGRTGTSSLSVSGKSSIVRDRIGRSDHRTSGSSNAGQMKTAGRASPSMSRSTRRDDMDVDGGHRRMSAGNCTPDGGKPIAAAAVVSGSSIGGKMGVGLVPSSPVGSAGGNGDLEAQLSRYAALQHQLSLAAAVAASGRVPPSLYQPMYGAGSNAALSRTPTFHDIAAAVGLHSFPGVSSQSGSASLSGASSGISSSSSGLYPPLGCLPGLPPFPPSFGSSSFPSLLDPILLQACANAAAMAVGVQTPSSSASSMFSDYSAKIKAAATHSGSSSHAACKDPYCFRCQLAAIFQLPPVAAASFCNGGVSPSHGASHMLGQPSTVDKQSSAAASGMLPSSLSPYLPLHAAMLLQQLQQQSPVGLPGYGSDADMVSSANSPFVCSWVDGPTSEFCGKRYSSSDELLRHLRTHASSIIDYAGASSSAASGFLSSNAAAASGIPFPSGMAPGSAMAAQAAAALQAAFAAAAVYPSGPSRHSPGAASASSALDMQQAGGPSCGTGHVGLLSSGGSLLMNSSRYHPYSKSSSSTHASALYSPSAAATAALVSSLPPNSLSTPHHFGSAASAMSSASSLPFQTLSSSSSAAALQAFYSPYAAAVYGQRLGAAAVGP